MVIYGGQYCLGFKERVKIIKELEEVYDNKVKIQYKDNFISYTAFTDNALAR